MVHSKVKICSLFIAFILGILPVLSAGKAFHRVPAAQPEAKIEIDGILDEDAWQEASSFFSCPLQVPHPPHPAGRSPR